jgi:hypothetical protein
MGVNEELTGELVRRGPRSMHALSFQGADKETNDRLSHSQRLVGRKRASLLTSSRRACR